MDSAAYVNAWLMRQAAHASLLSTADGEPSTKRFAPHPPTHWSGNSHSEPVSGSSAEPLDLSVKPAVKSVTRPRDSSAPLDLTVSRGLSNERSSSELIWIV